MAIRFLVVDDATFIRDMVKKQLRDRFPNCEIADAVNGARAIAQLKAQRADVILSDWEMPGMSGEEFLQWVRSQEQFAETPFIMVTSRGDRDHVVSAIKKGVSDFISKPFTADELYKKVYKQLAKVGKVPKKGAPPAAKKGSVPKTAVSDGLGALTAGISTAAVTGGPREKAQPSPSAAALTGEAPKAPGKPVKGKKKNSVAQLRLATGESLALVVRDMNLQVVVGLIQRSETLPTLFDQCAIDIELEDQSMARLNGFISSMSVGDPSPNTKVVKMEVRFVDNDPEKFEALSRFIAKMR